MGRDKHANAPQAEHECPACHHPVHEEIKRHKTMGIYVPVWRPGHCRNPSCPEYTRTTAPELHGHH
ncbi:hypothetical protein SUDANB145_03552 [Streptomyces sp. enrichment culture]|uniref:hypothetical protein n=1 Tax=Streptomyces sp. enrichment culture TaxID=1795815 RepID=UPI003F547370